jgi:hypothetical protein
LMGNQISYQGTAWTMETMFDATGGRAGDTSVEEKAAGSAGRQTGGAVHGGRLWGSLEVTARGLLEGV